MLQRRIIMTNTYKPGEKAPKSGQYEIIGPRGGIIGKERTIVKKEPFPPTPKSGQRYILSDPTKNGAGKSKK
jgi:hypothetical protein